MIPLARSISRRSLLALGLVSLVFASACDSGSSGPRALILVDAAGASGPAEASWVDARKADFEAARGRAVRVLRVGGVGAAIELAARGEADVAVLPAEIGEGRAELDRFFASDHGREVGIVSIGEGRVRILAVSAKQHPKVDAQGEALAQFLAASAR